MGERKRNKQETGLKCHGSPTAAGHKVTLQFGEGGGGGRRGCIQVPD